MRTPRVGAIWILLGVFLVFILAFGARYHRIEDVNSAEWDGYVAKADAIRRGTLPHDVWHPLLYPILAAGAGELVGDTFAGARAVSSLFAVLFAWSAFLIGRRCFSPSVGVFAALATMLNPNVLFIGVHTATDMMFAAWSALTVVAALRAVDDARIRCVVIMGALFALAYFTRYTAIALLPALVVPILFAGREHSRRQRAVRLLVFVATCLVVLVPHFVLTDRALGSPFANESWKNLAFKLYGGWDWSTLNAPGFENATSVVGASPLAFIASAARELAKFFYFTLLALGGHGIAGAFFAAGLVVGAYSTLWTLDRARLILWLYVAGCVVFACVFFYTSPRLMLPILAVCYVWVGHALFGLVPDVRVGWGRLRFHRALPLAVVVLLATAVSTLREIPMFIASHPVAEVEAVVQLEKDYGSGITVLGTTPYFGRHVHYQCLALRLPPPRVGSDLASYVEYLRPLVHDADFVLLGRMTGRGVPQELLDGSGVPDYLEPVEITPSVALYRVRPETR
jgi:hypothetical protein